MTASTGPIADDRVHITWADSDTEVYGRVEYSTQSDVLYVAVPNASIIILSGQYPDVEDAEVTVVSHMGPHMPTEPGIYKDDDGDLWAIDDSGLSNLRFLAHGSGNRLCGDETELEPEDFAPFTRLSL